MVKPERQLKMGIDTGASQPMQSTYQRTVDVYFEAAAQGWNDIYQRHDVEGAIYQERRRRVWELIEHFGVTPSSRVLEIGCGAGLTTVDLARRGCLVDAVDTVHAMLEFTRRHAAEAGVADRVRTLFADVYNLPFEADTFRLVLAIGVIPWLPSAAPAIREMARVLAPGGDLIVTADHTWGLSRVVDPLSNRLLSPFKQAARKLLARPNGAEARTHTRPEIDCAIGGAGLQKICGSTVGFGPFTIVRHRLLPEIVGLKLNHQMQALADRGVPLFRSGGAQYLVTARKIRRAR